MFAYFRHLDRQPQPNYRTKSKHVKGVNKQIFVDAWRILNFMQFEMNVMKNGSKCDGEGKITPNKQQYRISKTASASPLTNPNITKMMNQTDKFDTVFENAHTRCRRCDFSNMFALFVCMRFVNSWICDYNSVLFILSTRYPKMPLFNCDVFDVWRFVSRLFRSQPLIVRRIVHSNIDAWFEQHFRVFDERSSAFSDMDYDWTSTRYNCSMIKAD